MAVCPSCNQEKGCPCSWSLNKAGIKVCGQCVRFSHNPAMYPNKNAIGNSPGSNFGNSPVVNETLKITPPLVTTELTPQITGVKYLNFNG